MAVSLWNTPQIFLLGVAGLRLVRTGSSGARCFATSPLASPGVFTNINHPFWGELLEMRALGVVLEGRAVEVDG